VLWLKQRKSSGQFGYLIGNRSRQAVKHPVEFLLVVIVPACDYENPYGSWLRMHKTGESYNQQHQDMLQSIFSANHGDWINTFQMY